MVLGRPIERVPHLAHLPVADVLLAGPPVWIYRLQTPGPRVKLTTRIQVADADATNTAGGLALSPAPDRALIDDDTPPAHSYAGLGTNAGSARITAWRPNSVEIDADSERGGMLVLHDIYYPGWVAEIDGHTAPICGLMSRSAALNCRPGGAASCSGSSRSRLRICARRWRASFTVRTSKRPAPARIMRG